MQLHGSYLGAQKLYNKALSILKDCSPNGVLQPSELLLLQHQAELLLLTKHYAAASNVAQVSVVCVVCVVCVCVCVCMCVCVFVCAIVCCCYSTKQSCCCSQSTMQQLATWHRYPWFYFVCIVRCIGLCHYYQGIKRMEKGSRNRRKAESENMLHFKNLSSGVSH